jgi:hypothetical protein
MEMLRTFWIGELDLAREPSHFSIGLGQAHALL